MSSAAISVEALVGAITTAPKHNVSYRGAVILIQLSGRPDGRCHLLDLAEHGELLAEELVRDLVRLGRLIEMEGREVWLSELGNEFMRECMASFEG